VGSGRSQCSSIFRPLIVEIDCIRILNILVTVSISVFAIRSISSDYYSSEASKPICFIAYLCLNFIERNFFGDFLLFSF
jgi:hypothetical protein